MKYPPNNITRIPYFMVVTQWTDPCAPVEQQRDEVQPMSALWTDCTFSFTMSSQR